MVGHAMANGTLPARTTVEGVAIGRMNPDDAKAALENKLGRKVTAPITVADHDTRTTITPAKSGLVVDWNATVDLSLIPI